MGYRLLDHVTDAVVEVTAGSLDEAFGLAGQAVIEMTLDPGRVAESQRRTITASGEDLRYLLFAWLEEIIYEMITEGFAISRVVPRVSKNSAYTIKADAYGEPIDTARHGFKVEIKAPTFHEMEITHGENVKMKFLLDL